MAAMAATIRKFQSLRLHALSTTTSPTTNTSLSSSTLSKLSFSSLPGLKLSSTTPATTATINFSTASPFFQLGSLTGKSFRICNFSSFRPPPPPPRSPSQQSPPSQSGMPPSDQQPVQSRLHRPPSISLNRIPPRLRNHAVSLFHGDYKDYDKDDPSYQYWKRVGPLRFEGEENDGDDDDAYGDSKDNDDDDYDDEEDEDGDFADWSNDDSSLSLRDRWLIREAKLREQKEKAQRKKWIENAKPKTFTTKIDVRGRSYGRGGRKTAHARVWIQPGFGNVVVNRKDFVEYFTRDSDRENIIMPFCVTDTAGQFDVQAYVAGGGTSGQAGAVRHGVARALQNYNPDSYRRILKSFGFLTRDPRQVERKKIGRKKARKKRQWNRR